MQCVGLLIGQCDAHAAFNIHMACHSSKVNVYLEISKKMQIWNKYMHFLQEIPVFARPIEEC